MIARLLKLAGALALLLILAVAWALSDRLGWLLAGLTASGLFLSAHLGLLFSEFMLTAWLGRDSALPAGTERIRCGSRWRAWRIEIPAALLTFGWRIPWLGDRPLPSGSDRRPIPVLLVHGYFCNRAVFIPLARTLAGAGHHTGSVNLEPLFDSIDRYPALIEAGARELLARSGAPRIAVIGHSMGGLAIRAWLRDYDDAIVASVITLGSPHQGTKLARIGYVPIVRQMQHQSPWLTSLATQEPLSRTARFTTIISEHDNIVTPQAPQTLPKARCIAFRGIGHLGLSIDPAAHAIILRELATLAA